MNRNELKTIAEGFKAVRPVRLVQGFTNAIPASADNTITMHQVVNVGYEQWERDVHSVAHALQLVDKQRSNFLAACGLIHNDQG